MNHFLLSGNELVADWPEPLVINDATSLQMDRWLARPRYTCSKELLAMLKDGERYELNKHFRLEMLGRYEQTQAGNSNGIDVHSIDQFKRVGDAESVAVPVEKGEESHLKFTIDGDKKWDDMNDHERLQYDYVKLERLADIRKAIINKYKDQIDAYRSEIESLKQQLSKH